MSRNKNILLVIGTLVTALLITSILAAARARAQAVAAQLASARAQQLELANAAEAQSQGALTPSAEPGTTSAPPSQSGVMTEQHYGPSGAALVCRLDDELCYAIFTRQNAAHFDITVSGSDGRESGWLKFPGGKATAFHRGRNSAGVGTLGVSGHEFELRNGRVCFVAEDGTAVQVHVFPTLAATANVDALAGLEVENDITTRIQKLQDEHAELLRTQPGSVAAKSVEVEIAKWQDRLSVAARKTSAALNGSDGSGQGRPSAAGGARGAGAPPAARLPGLSAASSEPQANLLDLGRGDATEIAPASVAAPDPFGGGVPSPGLPGIQPTPGSGFTPRSTNNVPSALPPGMAASQTAAQMLRESELKAMRRHYENVLQRVLEAQEKVHIATTDANGNTKAQPDQDVTAQQQRMEVLQRYAEQLQNEITSKASEPTPFPRGTPGIGAFPPSLAGAPSTSITLPSAPPVAPNVDPRTQPPGDGAPSIVGRGSTRGAPGNVTVLAAHAEAQRAALASEQVALEEARDQLNRVTELYAKKFTSTEEMSRAKFAVRKVEARIAQMEAEIRGSEAEIEAAKGQADYGGATLRVPSTTIGVGPNPLVLEITTQKSGEPGFRIDGADLDGAGLTQRFLKIGSERGGRGLMIRAGVEVSAALVSDVMKSAKDAGIGTISLETIQPVSPPSALPTPAANPPATPAAPPPRPAPVPSSPNPPASGLDAPTTPAGDPTAPAGEAPVPLAPPATPARR